MNWRARLDSITNDHIAAVRNTEQQIAGVDERARAAIRRIGEKTSAAEAGRETAREREAREERDRLLREAAARSAERERSRRNGRDVYVLPSDWTDEDEARAEGYGPPSSWLR